MGGVVRKITKTIKKVVKAVVKVVTKVVSSVVSAVTSPFGTNIDIPDYNLPSGQDQSSAIQGVLLNQDSAISHIPVVYGQRKLGGTRVFVSTNGSNNKYLYVALVLAEGQVTSYDQLYVDDNLVPLSSYAHGVQASPTSGDYKGKLLAQFFDGRDNQTVSSVLDPAPGWTSNHRLQGLAYMAFRFEWKGFNTDKDPNNNPYGGIPRINVRMKGRKIKDITTVSAGHSTAYASETTAYSVNPVSVLADYLRNSRYGKGLDNNSFDWASWKTAADLANQTVSYTNGSTGKAFTCNAVLDTANSLMSNCKILLASFRGIMPYQAGQYSLKIEHAGDDSDIAATPTDPTTVFTVTQDHMIGGLTLDGESKEHKANRVIVTYVDPSADYQPNEVVYPTEGSSDDTAFLSEDNNVRLEKKITLPTVTSRAEAEQFARVFLRRSRTQKFISFFTNLATSNVTVGDLIRVQSPTIGLDGIFRIMDLRISTDATIEIQGIEHQASTYTINSSGDDYVRPTINLPNPLTVEAPTSLTLASGSQYNLTDSNNNTTYRIRADWTAADDPFIQDYVVQFKKSSDADYITFTQTSETYTYVAPVALGESYDVRVLARNDLGRRSNYVTSLSHKVDATYTPASGSSSTQSGGSITTITQNWSP